MARKSRKVDFVNVGRDTAAAAVKEEKTIFRAGLYARLSLESEANRERGTIENQMGLLKNLWKVQRISWWNVNTWMYHRPGQILREAALRK